MHMYPSTDTYAYTSIHPLTRVRAHTHTNITTLKNKESSWIVICSCKDINVDLPSQICCSFPEIARSHFCNFLFISKVKDNVSISQNGLKINQTNKNSSFPALTRFTMLSNGVCQSQTCLSWIEESPPFVAPYFGSCNERFFVRPFFFFIYSFIHNESNHFMRTGNQPNLLAIYFVQISQTASQVDFLSKIFTELSVAHLRTALTIEFCQAFSIPWK